MRYVIGGEAFDLGRAALLGVGGEGAVYEWKGCAVKIFHPLPPGLTAGEEATQRSALSAKIAKVRAFPSSLPSRVAAPIELVRTDHGDVAGFVMNAITGATEALRLGQRRWREGRVTNAGVTEIMKDAHATLCALHAQGVVVGDLNDANILVSQPNHAHFIDCDSMQFGIHRCAVGHERFLDPRLYGIDLTARQAFSDASDWYAFTVMLFASLLYVHPYGGQHPTHRTLLRRAEARHSIFRSDVAFPKAASHFGILPDALLHWSEAMFDGDRRGIFPASLLDVRWTTCSCGADHARARCPVCTRVSPVPRVTERHHGRATKVTLFETKGRILFATVQGELKYLCEERGVVRREDGSLVGAYDAARPAFAISGASTWFATEHGISGVCRGAPLAGGMTDVFQGEPIFDANARFTFRVENGWLTEGTTGARVGQVLEGHTWFRVGEELGFGLYRAGRVTFPFLFRPGESGIRHIELEPIEGRIVDLRAVFDGERVLFLTAVEEAGRRIHTMQLIGRDGTVLARASGSPEDQAMLASIHGKCMAHGRVLAATDGGLLLIKPDLATRTFVEERLFTDTGVFLTSESELLAGPQGSVYVIDRNEISQLTIH